LSRGVGAAQEQLRSESLRKDALTSGAVAVLSVAILLSAGLHAHNAALWWCAPWGRTFAAASPVLRLSPLARSSLLAWGGR